MRSHLLFFLCAAIGPVVFSAGCDGTIGSTGDDRRQGQVPGADPTATTAGEGGVDGTLKKNPTVAVEDSAGLVPLQRLSRVEYINTVRDLLADSARNGSSFPSDGIGPSGFDVPGGVSDVEARSFQDASEQLAASAVKNLNTLLGCDPASGSEMSCVAQFIKAFGQRAYRRPLEPAELTDLQSFYSAARSSHDAAGAVGLLLRAMLQSPKFLYHWQLGSEPALVHDGLIQLGPYELASRLSYFLWRSMPDAALFQAAASGKLQTPAGVAEEVQRMFADPKAKDAVSDFHLQWLALRDFDQIQKDTTVYPEFTPATAQAMLAETSAFASNTLLQGDGRLETLLTSKTSFISAPLAKIYGVSGVSGASLVKVDLDPAQRAGIFTQASFLSAQASADGSHPIRRGKVIWNNVVCGVVPPPPPNVPPPEPVSPNLSTRDRFAAHAANACAKACHELFDPPGFAFENYDGIGRFRTMDGGKAVDASGTIKLPLSGDRSFRNAVELMGVLANSEDARQCSVRQWSRYALKRHEVDAEAGSLQSVYETFQTSGNNIRELLGALATTKTFLNRTASSGEVVR